MGAAWTHLQTLQEQAHAPTVQEHLTVVGRLVCDVPQGAPGKLHHLVTLRHTRKHKTSALNNKTK